MLESRRWVPWMVVLVPLCVGLLRSASAHPFGQDFWALRTELRMGVSGPEIVVMGEVPIMVVLAEFRRFYKHLERPGVEEDLAYRERKLDELRQHLGLRANDVPVRGSWTAADSPKNGLAGEGSFLYMLQFEPAEPWSLDGERLEIEVVNGAYPGLPLWLSAHVGVAEGAGWAATSSTARDLLGDGADLVDVDKEPDGWTTDEALRTVRAVFERVPAAPVQEPSRGGCLGW